MLCTELLHFSVVNSELDMRPVVSQLTAELMM